MKLGLEDKKKTTQLAVVGVGAVVALYFLYGELFGGPTQAPPAPPVILTRTPAGAGTPVNATLAPPGAATRAAQRVATSGQQLDPTLHMEAMRRTESLVYSGAGRNIFAAGPPPAPPAPKLVQAKFPARPAPVYVPPAPTGPPPPPPLNLKFFGTATTADGTRKAFLLSGDDVLLAAQGDVVAHRYRIVSIAPGSIQVEDLPNANRQSLPVSAN